MLASLKRLILVMNKKKKSPVCKVLPLLMVPFLSACGLSQSPSAFEYREPEIKVEAQPRNIPAVNRHCIGKPVVPVLAGSENNGLEARGPNDEDSIVEQFNRQSPICIDLRYAGTMEIAVALRDGTASVDGKAVDLFLPAATWAFDYAGRAKIAQFQSISQTNVVLGLKPGLVTKLTEEFKQRFGQDLASVNKLTLDQVNWIFAHKESVTAATSPTHSNSGFSYAVAAVTEGAGGSVSAKSFLQPNTTAKMKEFFSNVDFGSSSTGFVTDLLLQHPEVNAVLTYEMLGIQHNTRVDHPKSPDNVRIHNVRMYYLDLPLADMPLGLRTGADAPASQVYPTFLSFLRRTEVQDEMVSQGRRLPFSASAPFAYPTHWGVIAKPDINRPQQLQQVLIQRLLEEYALSVRPRGYSIWALDYSGSMEGTGEEILESILGQVFGPMGKNFFVAPRADDTVVLVPFESTVREESAITVRGDTEKLVGEVAQFAEANRAGGGTDGFAAVRWATIKYNQDASKDSNLGSPTVFFVSDGEFGGNFDRFMDWAKQQAGSYEKFVIPQVIQISVGTSPNTELDKLAKLTGGRSITVSAGNPEELAEKFRYVLGYRSNGFRIQSETR